MRNLYVKLQHHVGLTLILLIGLGVEFSNFQSLFFRFMSQYRADWGGFNHLPAACLSAFLLLCIVIFGIRKQFALSWCLALLTSVVSFAVYNRMGLSWRLEELTEVNFVVLLLSGLLPLLVAYTTHQITQEDEYLQANGELATQHERGNTTRVLKELHKLQTLMAAALEASNQPQRLQKVQTVVPTTTRSNRALIQKIKKGQQASQAVAASVKPEPQNKKLVATVMADKKQPDIIEEKPKKTASLYHFTCEVCGQTGSSKSSHAKYCSVRCRTTDLKKQQKTAFYTKTDDFDANGVIEWNKSPNEADKIV
jgi:hypothetical protein